MLSLRRTGDHQGLYRIPEEQPGQGRDDRFSVSDRFYAIGGTSIGNQVKSLIFVNHYKTSSNSISFLKNFNKEIESKDQITKVATISSGSEEVGELIANAMEKVGRDGIITIEEGKTSETEIDVVCGMQFDHGYISPYMVTDPDKMETVFEDPYIYVTDKKISNVNEILPILEKIVKSGDKLLIVAEDVEGEAISTIVLNKLRGVFNVACVKAPYFGDKRKEFLEDLAIATGAILVCDDNAFLEEDPTYNLGKAKSVKITKDSTVIVDGSGEKEQVEKRIASIKKQLETCQSDYDKSKLEERLAKLSGGVAVIKVGAATETEMKEKKLRIEDALAATKAATKTATSARTLLTGGQKADAVTTLASDVLREVEAVKGSGAALGKTATQELSALSKSSCLFSS